MPETPQWFYSKDGESTGPFSAENLAQEFGGQIPRDLFVWHEGWDQWKRAEEVPELKGSLSAARADGVVMEAIGKAGTLQLVEAPDRVRIVRKGALARMTHGSKGDKEILVSRITSIQFKKPSTVTSGYIQIGFSGGKESKGGVFDAAKDENTVMFSAKQVPAFEGIKAEIERRMDVRSKTSMAPQVLQQASKADEIMRLAELRDQGVLSEEEFSAAKKKILGI